MNDRPEGDVEHCRGMDPEWRKCGGLSYINFLVRASCEATLQALQRYRVIPKSSVDLLEGGMTPVGPIPQEPVYVYQLQGHEWTQVETWGDVVMGDEEAQDLSRRLKTQAFIHGWEATASARFYQLFNKGELAEAYSMLHDCPIYQGEQGEADLQQKLAEGWQISRDHTFEFLTRRGTPLDIEFPEACYALSERVMIDLDMFVACRPFWLDPTLKRVVRMEGWERVPFAAAKALHHSTDDQ